MEKMTSLQRVLAALSHKAPDRIPLFLLLSMHGAKELGLSIKDYFSNSENVVKGQLKLLKKFEHDCIYTFFYAGIEIEAMGGKVLFSSEGPPNSGDPIIESPSDIENLQAVNVETSKPLQKVFQATRKLKEAVKDEVPIIGVVMSPFSIPVMQMGFSSYLDLMYDEPELFKKLMLFNEEFCVNYANAQIEAGATAICYFDPVSSPTMVPKEKFLETGFEIGKRTIARINGPCAIHFASGTTLPVASEITQMGGAVIGASTKENLKDLKSAFENKITILGNLNAIEMRKWTPEIAELKVKEAIELAGKNGGFILAENHGEIPWQVSDEILLAISRAVKKWGAN